MTADAALPPSAPPRVDGRTTLRGIPDLVAFFVALPAVIYMAWRASAGVATFSAAAFGAGLCLMLGVSGLYHTFRWSPLRKAFWARLDHAAIYIMIGASYTPFCLATQLERGPYILGFVWLCSLFGAAYCLLRVSGSRRLRATIYVLLGVTMVPFAGQLYVALPSSSFWLSLVGGASYIVGAVVYVARWPNPIPRHYGHHEVFHLFVFAGAAAHYASVWQLLVP